MKGKTRKDTMDSRKNKQNFLWNNKNRLPILIFSAVVIGFSLSATLTGCSLASLTPLAKTVELSENATETPKPAQTASPTDVPATSTVSPSPTATLPFSPVVMQAFKDAFNCITNNMVHAHNIPLSQFCPKYWDSTPAIMNKLDGVVIRQSLEPYLSPLDNLRWRFTSLTDVRKDEPLSSSVNQVYTAMLYSTLTGDVTLKCPSGSPAPFQTSVNIPINGEVRISVKNYTSQPQETIQIESWKIQGDPLKDYCTTLH
jgi:hypothetical protein